MTMMFNTVLEIGQVPFLITRYNQSNSAVTEQSVVNATYQLNHKQMTVANRKAEDKKSAAAKKKASENVR